MEATDNTVTITPDTYFIKNCARCGEDHYVTFKKLINPSDEWNYWALCPNTNEPIMMQIV
jgi:hypothetical protein